MKKYESTGYWIAIGAGIGTALGIAFNNFGVGIGIGIGLGIAISSVINIGKKNNNCHKNKSEI